jgi:GNAT superfamily N-acetyltransferase
VQVEPLEREEALYALIRNCARSGESWVALDDANGIVGFLLAQPDQTRRHYAEHEILELRYGGVVKTHRRRGIFTGLVERVLARMVPVAATVSPANQSGTVRLLVKLGFENIGSPGGEQRLRWNPGTAPGERR